MNQLIKPYYITRIVVTSLFVLVALSIASLYSNPYSLWYLLGTLGIWVLVGGLGVELGLHRYFSHGSFSCSKSTARLLGFLGCLSLNGDPIFWASVHNGSHHRYADTEKDVHSPIHGIFHSYLGWIIDPKTFDSLRFEYAGKRALSDKYFVYYQRYYLTIVTLTFLVVYNISPMFFFMSFIPGIFLAFNQGPMVNVLCHSSIGYRNYDTNDNSNNITWLSYLTFGLALHNNHHKYPNRANFAIYGEVDPGFVLIKSLGFSDVKL